jgi:hypothetical protein
MLDDRGEGFFVDVGQIALDVADMSADQGISAAAGPALRSMISSRRTRRKSSELRFGRALRRRCRKLRQVSD